jgi:hypothetical protein
MTAADEVRENRERLVAALRSGRYRQTRYELRDDDGFCVAGVMCDLYDPNGWKRGRVFFVFARRPAEVSDAFGFTFAQRAALMHRNDRGATFAELADVIESWPLPEQEEGRA